MSDKEKIFKTAEIFSSLPSIEEIRKHVKLAYENEILDLNELIRIFGSKPTLDRIKNGKTKSLKYKYLKDFYEKIHLETRPTIPTTLEEIEKEQKPEVLEEFFRTYITYASFYKKLEFPKIVGERLLEKVKTQKDMLVLDVATGPSVNAAIQIAPLVKKVIAIDASENVLREASSVLENTKMRNIELLRMNMENLRADWNELFDLILFNLAPVTMKALQQAYRVLKPKGYVAFSHFGEGSFNEIYDAMRRAVKKLGLQNRYMGPRPPLTMEGICKIFRNVKLRVKKLEMDDNFEEYGVFENASDATLFAELFMPLTNLAPFKEPLHWRELDEFMKKTEKELGKGKIKVTLNVIFVIAEK